MPVHDLGYRPWSGERLPPLDRWKAIVSTGVRLAWKGKYLKRLLIVAWIPVLYVAVLLVAVEWVMLQQGAAAVAGVLPAIVDGPAEIARLSALAMSEPGLFREELWRRLILIYFRTPQPILMALLVGLIAPPLISRDLRSRAWLIYFSRPVSRLEYMLGKCAVVAVYLLAITTLPALLVYLLGIGLAPTQEATLTTWTIPLRIVGASTVLIMPTTVLAVCFSSLWYNSRTSTFAWYAVWAVGALAYGLLTVASGDILFDEGLGEVRPGGRRYPALVLVSLYHMLSATQAWIFGTGPRTPQVTLALVGLTAVTLGAGMVLYRRISAPMRV